MSDAPAQALPKDSTHRVGWLLANPNYMRLFFGSLLATGADRFYQAAAVAALQLAFTDASGQVSLVHLAGVLAQFICYPFVGALVDRMNRRKVLTFICALKFFLIGLFIPLLLDPQSPRFAQYWWLLAILVFVFSAIKSPYGPARAAKLPDVVPAEHLGLGAGLIAAGGLLVTLAATASGKIFGHEGLEPWVLIPVAIVCYAVAWLCLRGISDPAIIPDQPAVKAGWGEYFKECTAGAKYSAGRRGIIPIMAFEAVFWIAGVLFFVLINWFVPVYLNLDGRAKVVYIAESIAYAGIGLMASAILMGKFSRQLTPILTYPLAVLLAGYSMLHIFSDPTLTHYILFGAAGGLLIGRIDADLLSITGSAMRGRVFALKGFIFTGAMILPLAVFPVVDHFWPTHSFMLRDGMIYWAPRLLLAYLPAVIALAWLVDCGLYAEHGEQEQAGLVERFSYFLTWWVTFLISKFYFRLTVIGAEKIPTSGPVILAPNHGSFFDPLWLGAASPRQVQYMMHAHYYRGIGHPWFRMMNTVPVDESNQLRAIKTCSQALAKGICVGIFPEGTVTSNGQLSKAKIGTVFIAQKANAPILPVAIKGNLQAFPRKAKFPMPVKITVIICDPVIVPQGAKKEELGRLTDQIMNTIADKMELPHPPSSLLPDDPPPVPATHVKPAATT